jgi:nucleotide-binding universal stress UspA family protein
MVTLELRRSEKQRAVAAYRRVLVPVVDGPEGELAVDLACRLAAPRHAAVVALAPIEVALEFPLDAPVPEEEDRAHALIERALAIAASYGVRLVPRIVHTRSTSDSILDEAARRRSEIIVIPLPPHAGARTLGRTADSVVKNAECRVMLARAAMTE